MPRREPEWRIVGRPLNDLGDAVYDVYFGARRLAWGLKDKAAADRWVARLAGGDTHAEGGPLLLEPPGEAADELVEELSPPRVWWNE